MQRGLQRGTVVVLGMKARSALRGKFPAATVVRDVIGPPRSRSEKRPYPSIDVYEQ